MLAKLKSVLTIHTPKNNQPLNESLNAGTDSSADSIADLRTKAKYEAKAGHPDNARQLLHDALEIAPDDPELLCDLGRIERKQGLYEDARDNFLTAIHLAPNIPATYVELGDLCLINDQLDEALAFFEQAHQLEPENPSILCGIGNVYMKKSDYIQAISIYEHVIDKSPGYALAYNNISYCYSKLMQYDLALEPALIARELDPQHLPAYINLNHIYYSLGQLDKAYKVLLQGLAVSPNNEKFRWALSWSLLLFKRFDKGWPEYEYRFSSAGDVKKRQFPFPLWQGELLTGKTIFIAAEQGLGDQIMFSSCLPDLIDRAGHCVLECNAKLTGLFQTSFPQISVIGSQMDDENDVLDRLPPAIDLYTHIGSLPRWLRNNHESFIPSRAYLKAQPDRIEYWRQKLATLGPGLKIGISWRGGVDKTRGYIRTIPLKNWEPLLSAANCHFINLQYDDCVSELEEIRALYGIDIHHWPSAIEDYNETAALISTLDIVISVCTSAIHLSGALGQHTWVLVPVSPEWRYLAKGESLPWYQNVKIFRQQKLWEWAPTINQVAGDLSRLTNKT